MTDDLVTKARKGGLCEEIGDQCPVMNAASGCFCAAVADRITALTEKNQSLALDHLAALGQAAEQIEALTADNARLRAERDAILADSTINSDQRAKYEALCARLSVGKASEHEAINAIRQLCQDNERLALRCSDARAALTGKADQAVAGAALMEKSKADLAQMLEWEDRPGPRRDAILAPFTFDKGAKP